MDREIKFRAWDNKNKYMVTSKQGVFTALRNSMNIVRQDNGYYNNGDLLKPNKGKYTLMQFTGLEDKNGKEIYEGDILKFSEVDTAIVIWNEKYAYFMVKPIQEYYFDSDVLGQALEYNDNVEKIGNIYDNPELLGGE